MFFTILTSSSLLCRFFNLLLLVVTHASLCCAIANPKNKRVASVSSSSKGGLAWPNGDTTNMAQYLGTNKISWYYTWSPDGVSEDEGLEFVPMLWGATQTNDWTASINSTIRTKKVTAVLGMNEPQQSGQSNLTAQQGVTMWQTYIEPLRTQGIRLGSPATSSAPSGKVWMQDWLQACGEGCTVDFIALHWYDVNATNFIAYLQDFHNTFQKPIWVTEWACQNYNSGAQCSAQDIDNFLSETQTFMNNTDWVERYSWFGAMRNMQGVNEEDALMDTSGNINALGRQYIGANTTGPVPGGVSSSLSTFGTSWNWGSMLCVLLTGWVVSGHHA